LIFVTGYTQEERLDMYIRSLKPNIIKQILGLGSLFFIVLCSSQVLSEGPGTTAFNFLKIGEGARPIAMGSAFTAVADDGNLLFWNPGGFSQIETPMGTTTYRNYVAGIHTGYLAYLRPKSEKDAFGGSVHFLYSGSMVKTNMVGEPLGDFTYSVVVPTIGYGRKIKEDVSVGIAIKGIYQNVDEFNNFGVAADIGGLYETPREGLTVGAVVQNLGAEVQPLDSLKYSLPITGKIGGVYRIPEKPVTIALDLSKPIDNDFAVSFGGEAWLSSRLAFRGGFTSTLLDLKTGSGTDFLAGISSGVGLLVKNIHFDYAITPMIDLGLAHRISLSKEL
jgi:hypothetical protein